MENRNRRFVCRLNSPTHFSYTQKFVFVYFIDYEKLVEILVNSCLVDYTTSFTTVRLYVQSDLTGMQCNRSYIV